MKKIVSLIILVIIVAAYFIIVYMPKNYKSTYLINDFEVKEEFFKDENIINFDIKKNDIEYSFSLNKNYSKRHVIKQIKEYEEDDVNCIYPIIDNVKTFILCNKDNQPIHFSLINKETFSNFLNKNYKLKTEKLDKKYKNINLYNYDDSIYLVWNYDSIIYLNEEGNKKMSLFESEVLDTSLITLSDNQLLIPNYDEKYSFKSIYLLDVIKFEKELWELDYEISYDSYINGIEDSNIYLVDRKNKTQYKINPHRKKIEVINDKENSPVIYNNGWENISIKRLVNNDYKFEKNKAFNYSYDKNKLNLNTYTNKEILLLEQKNIKIIYSSNHKVYYLKEDDLFVFDLFYGTKKLLSYFEWNFNNHNKIFIYNK